MVHYECDAWGGAGEGTMDELIGRRRAGFIGADRNVAKTAAGLTREFIAATRGEVGDALGETVGVRAGLSLFV